MLPDAVYQIYGFLSPDEMQLLYDLAKCVPVGGTIVEIGSFQGKSTVCLGLGAKQVPGVAVYAIDPHVDCQVNETTHYGMENHAALLRNLIEHDLGETVRVIAMDACSVCDVWPDNPRVDLLWIDGSHVFSDVLCDLFSWHEFMSPNGRIAIHDSSGHFPGVTQALNEFLAANKELVVAQIVDATTVLERSHG